MACVTGKPCPFPSSLHHAGCSWSEHHIGVIAIPALSVIRRLALWWSDSQTQGREEGAEKWLDTSFKGLKYTVCWSDILCFCLQTGERRRLSEIWKIYRAYLWSVYLAKSKRLLCCSVGHKACLNNNFSVLPQSSNSINIIKLLNSPALKRLAVTWIDEWIRKWIIFITF